MRFILSRLQVEKAIALSGKDIHIYYIATNKILVMYDYALVNGVSVSLYVACAVLGEK